MKKRLALVLGLLVLCAFSATALDPKIEGIISKIKENQMKIKDLSADIVTLIKSDTKDKKSLEQKGSILVKGEDKSRMEMTAPVPQITVTSKDKMMVVNPATGQKFVQDLKKLRKQTGKEDLGQNPLDQTKILDYFDLTVEERGIISKSYVITGTPKNKNKFMGKVKFYVDEGRYVPTKIEIYNAEGKLISGTDLGYIKIKDIWVVDKNSSWISVPGGKMEVSMRFNNIKINEGVSDKAFEIK